MSDEKTIVKRTESALDDFLDLWRRRKIVSIIVLIIILAPAAFVAFDRFITIPNLHRDLESHNSKIASLEEKLAEEKRFRDKAEESLERFKLLADRKLPDIPPDQRLDKMLEKMDAVLLRFDEATTKMKLDSAVGQSTTRAISSGTKRRFYQELRNAKPMNVEITSVLGDQESFALAHQIKELFELAKWPTKGVSQAIFSKPVKGLVVRISELPPPDVQRALAMLFDEFGYQRIAERTVKLAPDTLQVIVGSRP